MKTRKTVVIIGLRDYSLKMRLESWPSNGFLGKQSELRKSPWLIIIPSFQTEEIVILILITSFMVSSTV